MSSINDIVRKLRENRILNERTDYSSKSREDLIALAQDGDQLAVETLIKSHKDFIKKMSSNYFLDSGDKDDVEQIATIAFWDAINSYNPKTSGDFEAFAGMIIKRKLTDALRKDDTEKAKFNSSAASMDDTIASDGEGGDMTLGDTLVSKDASPEEEYLGRDGARELMNFMKNNLSDTEQKAIWMYIDGYKVSEIAEETGMKYKSVENALNRVKGKIAQWQKTRESKTISEGSAVEFTDEEKKVLTSILSKIQEQKTPRDSKQISQMRESYENYTESQLDKELDNIEDEIDDIVSIMRDTHYDNREELMDELEGLRSKLFAMEDYLSDEQYKKYDDLLTEIGKAEDTEYEGPVVHRDPYKERGLNSADFY